MATATVPNLADSTAVLPEEVYRLSVAQYHEMVDAGILTTEDRVELIDGILVKKMTIYPLHAFAVESLADRIKALAIPGWCYRSQQPITLVRSEPEPDGALVRGELADYCEQHPLPPNIGLVVEVAESSLRRDRGIRKRIYAKAAIPVYWIVNLVDQVVEVYTSPQEGDYPPAKVFSKEDKLSIELDGKHVGEISIATLFGK
jgi:Uma2 family endonuclease